MPHLKYTDATGRPAIFDLDGREREVVIGRLPGCDIVLPQQVVSRKHTRIYFQAKQWTVADLSSAHGTYVNQHRVSEKILEGGDKIAIGDHVFSFLEEAAPARPARARAMPGTGARLSAAAAKMAILDETAPNPMPKKPDSIIAEQTVTEVNEGELMQSAITARALDFAALAFPDEKPAKGEKPEKGTKARRPTGRSTDSRLMALVRISDGIHRCLDARAVCRVAVEMAIRATVADRGVLALRDQTSQREFLPMAQLVSQRGSLVHGPVKTSRTFVDRVVNQEVALVAQDTDEDEMLSKARSVVSLDIRSIVCAPLWDASDALGYLYLDRIGGGRTFGMRDLDLLCVIGYHAAAAITRLRLAERIREEESRRQSLSRFFSGDVIRHIEEEGRKGRLDPMLSTAEKEVTIVFTDIVGFATISEGLSPPELKHILDAYFDRMTEILVDRNGGTLDKYIGDGIMALFGAPFSRGVEEDAGFAVRAAVEMRDAIEQLRKVNPDLAKLEIRIGVNTGKVIAGMIGSKRRLEYSVLGDAVNVASRLETTCEPGRIQIGEATYEAVKDRFVCEYAGDRPVKNRARPVKSWWVLKKK